MPRIPSLMFLAAALFSASLHAQQLNPVREPDGQDTTAAAAKIYSNLGPPTSAYYGLGFWQIYGPNNPYGGSTQFVALGFTSGANAHVKQVRAAVLYIAGTNQINLSLYADSNGIPGALLAGPVTVTNLPTYGSCCQLAIANFPISVAITAGTQYWVVANTPSSGTGSDFFGTWNYVPLSKQVLSAYSPGGWTTSQAPIEEPAGAVYGTIP